MKRRVFVGMVTGVAAAVGTLGSRMMAMAEDWRSGIQWPEPKMVDPPKTLGGAPSDAIILFDGKDMSAWDNADNWEVRDGYVTEGRGSISTKQKFGSVQLHIEFATPEKVEGSGQGRGNSGVFFLDGHYELQVLDSFGNPTYFDGQCGSIYKQRPPLVNVCAKPGEWQSYDVIFNRPILQIEGDKVVKVVRPPFITVFQNGVLIHNHFALEGDTAWHKPPEFTPTPEVGSIQLQDHGNPTRFRNIWVREIPDENVKPESTGEYIAK